METQAVHIIVHGRVQGVGYRMSAGNEARRLGLTGWVQNNRDGTVEIHAEGEGDALNRFLAWCRAGPPAARVDSLDSSPAATEGLSAFAIR